MANNNDNKPQLTKAQAEQVLAIEAERRLVDDLNRRATLPDGLSAGMFHEEDPIQKLIRLYAPECLDTKEKKATRTAYMAHMSEDNITRQNGYVPVLSEGRNVNNGADWLYTRDKRLQDAHLADVSRKSKARHREEDNSQRALTAAMTGEENAFNLGIETKTVVSKGGEVMADALD